jgi:hypothetical protein
MHELEGLVEQAARAEEAEEGEPAGSSRSSTSGRIRSRQRSNHQLRPPRRSIVAGTRASLNTPPATEVTKEIATRSTNQAAATE